MLRLQSASLVQTWRVQVQVVQKDVGAWFCQFGSPVPTADVKVFSCAFHTVTQWVWMAMGVHDHWEYATEQQETMCFGHDNFLQCISI
jgi:hypothetical protein